MDSMVGYKTPRYLRSAGAARASTT
jgi:hypothetical protein